MGIKRAKEILKIEAEAIENLIKRLDEKFARAVEIIFDCRGRVIVTGIGKSGLIGKKIAATFASTGTPALFLHSAEGVHGDLGMMVRGDVMIAISQSGATEEINLLLPAVKRLGIKLISLTGEANSVLAENSDVMLDVSVPKEACPFGLAPTASTTAALALGDALAVCLLERRGFKKEDFALFHPGGSLGKKLLKVSDLMHREKNIPVVKDTVLMREAILEMTAKRLGVTTVVNEKGVLTGIISDGDLRRLLNKSAFPLEVNVREIMTRTPATIRKGELAEKALKTMEDKAITSLVILDAGKKPEGIIHLHDLLKAGVV